MKKDEQKVRERSGKAALETSLGKVGYKNFAI